MPASPRNETPEIKVEEVHPSERRVRPLALERLPQAHPWQDPDLQRRELWRQARSTRRLAEKTRYLYYETDVQGVVAQKVNMAQLRLDMPYASIGLKLDDCVDVMIKNPNDPARNQRAINTLDAINTILDDCEIGINNRIQHITNRQTALITMENTQGYNALAYINTSMETQNRRKERYVGKQQFLDQLLENMQGNNKSIHELLWQYKTYDDQVYYGLPSLGGNAPLYGLTEGEYGRIHQNGHAEKQREKLDRGANQMLQHARLQSLDVQILTYERDKLRQMHYGQWLNLEQYNANYRVALINFAQQELDEIAALRGEMGIIGAHVGWPV